MIEKVENIKRPLKKGELFLVPCFVKSGMTIEDNWRDKINSPSDFVDFLNAPLSTKNIQEINPVIMHPHNDVENGQAETHYHLDYRFIKIDDFWGNRDSKYLFPKALNSHRTHRYGTNVRPIKDLKFSGELHYFILPVINENAFIEYGITDPKAISKSKLKHKCIHKGKCPHRGMDLSQVPTIDGVITCPLHGLKFNANTKSIIWK